MSHSNIFYEKNLLVWCDTLNVALHRTLLYVSPSTFGMGGLLTKSVWFVDLLKC